VVVVGFAGAFLGAVFTTVAPVVPAIAAYYGGGRDGAFVAQWLLTMPSIGIVVGGPATGWFVERFGARTMLLTCFVLFAIAGMSGLVIENMNLLLASRFLVGVVAAGQATAATALAGEVFIGERRGPVMGFQVALATLLGVVMTLATGALARSSWRLPFALYGIAFAVAMLTLFVVPKSPARRALNKDGSGSLMPLLPIFAVVTAIMMVSFINSNQIPTVLSSMGATDPSLLAGVLATSTLATTIGAVLYGRLRHVLGQARTSGLGGLLQALAVLFIAVTTTVAPTVASAVLLGFGSGILYPGFTHMILDRAPEAVRGRAIGLMFTAQFAGPFLSTALLMPAIGAYGRQDSLLVLAALAGAGWLIYLLRKGGRSMVPNPDPL
jgi:MFS family permease